MLPPSTAVETGVAAAVACEVAALVGAAVGVVPVGPDVAGTGVAELELQAAAARTAMASNEPNFFLMSSPSLYNVARAVVAAPGGAVGPSVLVSMPQRESRL
jgi:hypothetical protein